MRNIFEKLIDVLIYLAIIMGMILSYYGQRQDTLTQQVVSAEASDLINTVQTQGELTKDVYEDFLHRLDTTDMIYDIKMEHKELAIEPEYRLKTAEEIIDDQNAAYNGDNTYHYFPISTEIPEVDDPNTGDGLNMNTETNESILAKSVSTPSVGHTHTDDCYDGHVHKGSPGPFIIPHAHTTNASICGKYARALGYAMHCNNCGKNYPGWYSWYHREPSGALVLDGSDLNGYKICPYCSSNYTSRGVEVINYAHICGYDIDSDGDRYYDDTPVGVVVNYSSQYPPASQQKASFNNGCYTYHLHWTTKNEYNLVSGATAVPMTATYGNMFQKGLSNYCDVPKYWYIGNDSLGYKYPSYGVLYRTEYNASTNSFSFHFEAYKRYQYGDYIYSNPGFPAVLSETQFYSTYHSKDDFARLWNQIPNIGTVSSDYTTFCVNYTDTDMIDLCDYTIFNSWYLACGKEGNGRLACNLMVTSITPTNPIQAVYTNEPPITTATATFKDGSTKVVVCTTDFKTDSPIDNATVILTYIDALGRTNTATIKITVVARNRNCTNGHKYNLNNDGNDPGCPYCRAWLRSLEVADPASGSITIYRGTTLQDNGVILMATYLDGRKELIDTGYISNLDKNYIGQQTVTIGYKGKAVTLIVNVRRNIVQCPVCHRYYELYPDDTDPGCPYCKARVPVFTGKVLKYYSETYSNVIMDEIYGASGAYYFEQGDYFSISVTNRIDTIGTKILKIFFPMAPKITIHVEQGGEIRNEAAKGVK